MNNNIKIAGLYLNWTNDYCNKYALKLNEMGFFAKVIDNKVFYSHKPFTKNNAEEFFKSIRKVKNEEN